MSNAASRMGRPPGNTAFIKAEVGAEYGQATPRRFTLEVANVILTDAHEKNQILLWPTCRFNLVPT
jgi:hypothetical protein